MSKNKIFVSVVIPCLNEEATIAKCIRWAKIGIAKAKVGGEVLVVDNGSTDASARIARQTGAHVISESKRGYGQAYMTGIQKARGTFIIIGDADGTYDFRQINQFIKTRNAGADLVLGSRFKGTLYKHSMPFFNRWIGNPILTGMINLFYGCTLSDSQTGFRAFTKSAFRKMRLTSKGMEFASEMIIKSISLQLSISEVPVLYHPRIGRSKLSPITDAWRHIKAILIYSPTYVFIFPGILLTLIGFFGTCALLSGPLAVGSMKIDIHTMIVSVLATSLGIHIILTGFYARLYTVELLDIQGGLVSRLLLKYVSVTTLFFTGFLCMLIGLSIISVTAVSWAASGFTALARAREFIAAAGLAMIGAQLVFSSFLFGLLRQNK